MSVWWATESTEKHHEKPRIRHLAPSYVIAFGDREESYSPSS